MNNRKTVKELLSGKGEEVFCIFFKEWESKREASKLYDKKYLLPIYENSFEQEMAKSDIGGQCKIKTKYRCKACGKIYLKGVPKCKCGTEFIDPHSPKNKGYKSIGTVRYYFSEFKKRGWIDEKYIIKKITRKGNKKPICLPYLRFRANLKFLFDYAKEKGINLGEIEKEKINKLIIDKGGEKYNPDGCVFRERIVGLEYKDIIDKVGDWITSKINHLPEDMWGKVLRIFYTEKASNMIANIIRSNIRSNSELEVYRGF